VFYLATLIQPDTHPASQITHFQYQFHFNHFATMLYYTLMELLDYNIPVINFVFVTIVAKKARLGLDEVMSLYHFHMRVFKLLCTLSASLL